MKTLTPTLRPHTADDLEALAAIEEASFPNAWSRDALAGFLQREDSDCRVIELAGRVVGFFVVLIEPDRLHMVNIAVDPEFRRRGLALHALDRIDELALERGAEQIVLEVRETNLDAQLLYRKAGYRAVEIVSGYYNGEDAYRMVKRFDA
jgi:ribosomal-protein-alanine N-acetyltransferase